MVAKVLLADGRRIPKVEESWWLSIQILKKVTAREMSKGAGDRG